MLFVHGFHRHDPFRNGYQGVSGFIHGNFEDGSSHAKNSGGSVNGERCTGFLDSENNPAASLADRVFSQLEIGIIPLEVNFLRQGDFKLSVDLY